MVKNNDMVDLTKIVLSFIIVMIHTSFLNNYIYPIARLAVPIFMILSGFFAFNKIKQGNELEEKTLLMFNIIKRYAKLYLFWFIVLLPYTFYIRKYFTNGFLTGIYRFIQSLFLGSTFSGSWYIMATILGIIIIYYFSTRFSNKTLVILAIPFYLFATICSEFGGYISSNPSISYIYNSFIDIFGEPYFNFIIALLYIVIGKILSDSMTKLKSLKYYSICFFISLVCLIIEYYFLSKQIFFIYNCDCLIFLAPSATYFVFCIMKIKIKLKYARSFRAVSTIVYCIHIPIALIVSKFLNIIHITDSMNIITFIVTSILAYTGAIIILKLEKNRKFKLLRYSY